MTVRRSRRGFSLFDVAIGAVLFAMMFTVSAKFILALSDTAGGSLARSHVRRELATVRHLLAADFAHAEPCGDPRYSSAVLQVDAEDHLRNTTWDLGRNSIVFTANVDADPELEVVAWRVNDDTLQRGVINPTTSCSPDVEPTDWSVTRWSTVSSGVREVSGLGDAVFAGATGGQRVDVAGSCSDPDMVASCRFAAVTVRFAADGGDQDSGPVRFDETFRLTGGDP